MGRGSRGDGTSAVAATAVGQRLAIGRKLTRGTAQQLYGGEFAGVQVVVRQVQPISARHHRGWRSDGQFLMPGGDRILGHFVRELRERDGQLVAHHANMTLDPAYRGQGFGTAFIGAVEERYRALGVREITLEAGERGAYYWTKWGFDVLGPTRLDAALQVAWWWQRSAPHIKRLVREGELQAEQLDGLAERFIDHRDPNAPLPMDMITSMREIADLGREQTWTSPTTGERMWLGKALLINSSWSAIKRLGDAPA